MLKSKYFLLALVLAEDTEAKFRAVHKLLVGNYDNYEGLIARKICTPHQIFVVGQ